MKFEAITIVFMQNFSLFLWSRILFRSFDNVSKRSVVLYEYILASRISHMCLFGTKHIVFL